jgi:hypothetical protein
LLFDLRHCFLTLSRHVQFQPESESITTTQMIFRPVQLHGKEILEVARCGTRVHGCISPGSHGVSQAILAVAPWAGMRAQPRLLKQVCHFKLLIASAQPLVQVRVIALQNASATAAVEHQHVATVCSCNRDGVVLVRGVHVAQKDPPGSAGRLHGQMPLQVLLHVLLTIRAARSHGYAHPRQGTVFAFISESS